MMGLDAVRQKQLAQLCYWDDQELDLWIDARELYPQQGAVCVSNWDGMMLSADPVPDYPVDWQILSWPRTRALLSWRKWIPAWVLESCALFPSHQLRLLHFVARYPQLLELLDHAPILAWRLVKSSLDEAELVSLMMQKRTDLVVQVGWPGKAETVAFLRKLRLRLVNPQIAEQVDRCLFDDERLQGLQSLSRINSMALSLAARFPELIGCRLHHALASLPCRPMQCQAMIAQLEDAYRLADYLALPKEEVAQIGDSRYLVEVEQCYQTWLERILPPSLPSLTLSTEPCLLTEQAQWQAISQLQQHAWSIHWQEATNHGQLYAFEQAENTVAFWVQQGQLVRVRQQTNQLPTAEQLSQIHLWLVARNG